MPVSALQVKEEKKKKASLQREEIRSFIKLHFEEENLFFQICSWFAFSSNRPPTPDSINNVTIPLVLSLLVTSGKY